MALSMSDQVLLRELWTLFIQEGRRFLENPVGPGSSDTARRLIKIDKLLEGAYEHLASGEDEDTIVNSEATMFTTQLMLDLLPEIEYGGRRAYLMRVTAAVLERHLETLKAPRFTL